MPHIKDWVEPLMVVPALYLGVLDSSRMAGCFQCFSKVLHCSWWSQKALEGPGRLW